jgi:acyl-CoA thioester hydrolase
VQLPIKHTITHRAGYAETDQMGVIHHAAYLIWFERARIELLRALGANYRELEERGVVLPVRAARLVFHRPARFDDELAIETSLEEVRGVRCRFRYTVRRIVDDVSIAEGETDLAFCDREGRVQRRGPEMLRAMIEEAQNKSKQ